MTFQLFTCLYSCFICFMCILIHLFEHFNVIALFKLNISIVIYYYYYRYYLCAVCEQLFTILQCGVRRGLGGNLMRNTDSIGNKYFS